MTYGEHAGDASLSGGTIATATFQIGKNRKTMEKDDFDPILTTVSVIFISCGRIVVLFSLILTVGMIVDDAIVVSEYADRKIIEATPTRAYLKHWELPAGFNSKPPLLWKPRKF